MSIKKKPQAWQVRKIAYGLAAVVIGVLGWVGVLSDIQADQVADKVDQWLPILLGVIAPALAATKTNPGSDSTATDEELAVGARGALHEQVGRVGTAILGQLDNLPSAVLAAIRAEEKGEHDTTASAAATAEASTDYVYGR